VLQGDGLGAHGADQTGAEVLDGSPRLALVAAEAAAGGPFAGVGTELVIQPEEAAAAIEEDGVVGGDFWFAHHLDGFFPAAGCAARHPDGDVGCAFARSSKPRREYVVIC